MLKYLVAACIATLTLGQAPSNPSQTLPKCIPRHQGGPQQGGPIPQSNSASGSSQPLLRLTPQTSQGNNAQRTSQGSNLRTQPAFTDAALKSAESALSTQWKSFLTSKGNNSGQAPPSPPPEAWLRYQQTNNLTSSANIPAAFFQKWQSDFAQRPVPERPVGADGKQIPFCEESTTQGIRPVPRR